MTEVLHAPRTPDRPSSYYHSAQQPSGLRRSMPSSTALYLDNDQTSSTSSSSSSLSSSPRTDATPLSNASGAAAQTSEPDGTSYASIASTAAAALDVSIPPISEAQPEQVDGSEPAALHVNTILQHYRDVSRLGPPTTSEPDSATPVSSPAYHYSSSVEDDPSSPSETTLSNSSLATPTVYDDSMVKEAPSQQVDFLTHEWREEDIWSSWRHIIANRKQFGEKSRLENASWRQWAKHRGNFRTVTPESLNWLKESDITWLYGPLKAASSYPISTNISEPSSTRLSKSNSFVKKPILKKRCLSEVMLAKSLSTSSLVREAATSALFSGRRPRRSDASSEFSDSKFPSEAPSRVGETLDSYTSRSSSFCETPSCEKKHIRFDDVVEQCIAVDHPITMGLDEDSSDDENALHRDSSSTSSDDDGGLMMARKRRMPATLARPKLAGSRSNSHNGREIIKTLPNTTLKYRTDSPDITEQAQHHTFGSRLANNVPWNSSRISPSPSQETLRPTNPSANFLLPRDDEDSDDDKDDLTIDSDASWSFGSSNPRSSLGASSARGRGSRGSSASRSHTPGPGGYSDDDFRMEGMRRTGSGMFMPEEEEEREYATGILGRIGEGINTARDIAHVIWTVGWRT